MSRIFLFAFLLVLAACSQVKIVQTPPPIRTAIPQLRISGDSSLTQLAISSLGITINVTGNIAITTYEVSFFNPLGRDLEGELDFPLAPGQTISAYALEVNGKLREGVVVDKKQARIAFENTVRQEIDPGLVEKTQGNNFRTRIYPIPAKGYKKIRISVEEKLPVNGNAFVYQLPLLSKQAIDTFSIRAAVEGASESPDMSVNGLTGFSFQSKREGFEGRLEKLKTTLEQTFAFAIPVSEVAGKVFATDHRGKTYFYTYTPLDSLSRSRPAPGTVAVLWDVSASGAGRNRDKDKILLQKYLSGFDEVRVLLIPFHISAGPAETFSISGGDIGELKKRLDDLVYDGGTQLGALDLNAFATDEFLLFSDGLSTFGKKEIVLPSKPVIAINSSPSSDPSYLQYVARQTHGKFIDLLSMQPDFAVQQMQQDELMIVTVEVTEGKIDGLAYADDGFGKGSSIAGILESPSATLRMGLGFDAQHLSTYMEVKIVRPDDRSQTNIARIWAAMNIAELDLQYEKNKDRITSLGKEFSIVTRNTSLLVLDRVEDYVEHRITPPDELRKEYDALVMEEDKVKTDEKAEALEEALAAMKNLKDWWHGRTPPSRKIDVIDQEGEHVEMLASPPVMENVEVAIAGDSTATSYGYSTNSAVSEENMQEVVVTMQGSRSDEKAANSNEAAIEIKGWSPDAGYLEDLKKTPAEKRFARYLELKKSYINQPSFFVDAAKFFFEQKDGQTALRILSNVSEMKLEEPELLRIMAYELLEQKQTELAVLTFRELLQLREELPQSYRDLALALQEAGRHQEAISYLYQLVLGSWDERFGDVKSIALNEMNALIGIMNGNADVSAIDARFIYPMPVDVRIVVGWNTDNSDVDLWVTDPRNVKCSYEYPRTPTGGKISRDVTQGYGPEEFCIRKALKGDYGIEVNLYDDHRQTIGGPITIRAELFTNFGKPSQKRETINFRVTDDKEVVKIGALKFR
jgi:tetratricopeptide (TPR) repeat protein